MSKKELSKKLAKQLRKLLSSSVDNWSSYDDRDYECGKTAKLIIEIIEKTIEENL